MTDHNRGFAMTEPTILYIVQRIPYPLNSGTRIRQFQLLSAYARIGKVSLLCFYKGAEQLAWLKALQPYCESVHPLPFPGRRVQSSGSLLARLRSATALRPTLARFCFSREMQRLVEQLAPTSDIIHVGRLHMVPHVERVIGQRRHRARFVLDLDDLETTLKIRELEVAPPSQWQLRAREYVELLRLWRYQGKALEWFDRILVCSERDRNRLASRNKVVLVPNGADVPARTLPDESDGKTVLCLGTYGHWPNVDGLRLFLREILPIIQKEVPSLRVWIVGKDVPPEVAALHDGRTIFVAADVPSVEEYYRQATISVVPLRIGAGTRLRIPEAFALGRPVVTTSVGCEGLRVVNREHLLVADDPHAFAQSCIELLSNRQLRQHLVANARKLVQKHYTWDAVRNRVENLARGLLEESSGS